MDVDKRERRLRRRFGPPAEAAPAPAPASRRGRRVPRWLVGTVTALAVAGAAAGALLLATPHTHVAPGCWWWTAATVGQVLPGSRGCLRGYDERGGVLAEGTGASDYGLPVAYANPDQPVQRQTCPFAPGDAVVVRYHAVFDDGRTIVVIEDCR